MGLEWNLADSLSYSANTELEVTLEATVPEAGTYYLVGALYTHSGNYLHGTIFGVVAPEGSAHGVVSTSDTTVWSLDAEQSIVLPCKLIVNRTDVILGLFLLKMTEESPSLQYDPVVAQVSTVLTAPTAPIGIVTQVVPALLLLTAFAMIINKGVLK